MESKAMNVQLPSIADLAHSLPSSWKGDVCSSTPTSPSEAWLMKFWGLVRNTWKKVPDELTGFMVVPLIGSKFASPAFCQSNAALSKAHLKSLPANTADILSAVGCLCIAQAYADSVSCIAATDLPIIAALGCVRHLNVASSLKKLGQQKFEDLRRLLAYHILLPQEYQPQVWSVVRQCSIFEAAADIMTDLRQCNLQLMPNAAWERSLLDTSFLVPWKIVMYHTASALQQKLLKLSGLNVPELPDFLDGSLLPTVSCHPPGSKAEELLLQALDQLASFPSHRPSRNLRLMVDGKRHQTTVLVDSSSNLLQALFQDGNEGKPEAPALTLHDTTCFSQQQKP